MNDYTVFVPLTGIALTDGEALAGIVPGSAIVGIEGRLGSLDIDITIDFEGNVYVAQNLLLFSERVATAVGRAQQNYPTTSRRTIPRSLLTPVGVWRHNRVFLTKDGGLLVKWLDRLLLDPRELVLG